MTDITIYGPSGPTTPGRLARSWVVKNQVAAYAIIGHVIECEVNDNAHPLNRYRTRLRVHDEYVDCIDQFIEIDIDNG